MEDSELLDQVKAKFGIKDDKDLVKWIGLQRSSISEIRNGHRHLPLKQKVECYDHLGYAWARDAILAMFPDETKEKLRQKDNERSVSSLDDNVEMPSAPPVSNQ